MATFPQQQRIHVDEVTEVRTAEDTGELILLTHPAAPATELSDEALDATAGGSHVSLVKNLSKVFGWSPKQVDQILGRGGVPYTGGSGEAHTSSDTGAE